MSCGNVRKGNVDFVGEKGRVSRREMTDVFDFQAHSGQRSTPAKSSTAGMPAMISPPANNALSWIEVFASKYFSCAGCGGLLLEPVIVRETNVLACGTCASHLEPSEVCEPPTNVTHAVAELRMALQQSPSTAFSGRKIVKVRRPKQSALPQSSPSASAAGKGSTTYFHVVAGAGTDPHFSAVGGASSDAVQIQGLNPNVELATQKSGGTGGTPQKVLKNPFVAFPHVVGSNKAGSDTENGSATTGAEPTATARDASDHVILPNVVQPAETDSFIAEPAQLQPSSDELPPCSTSADARAFAQSMEEDLNAQTREFEAIEMRMRASELMELAQTLAQEVAATERFEMLDIAKRFKAETRSLLAKQKNSSKVLKNAADEKYESSQYNAAVELYTKAIEARSFDGLTKLSTLHGNRSAALYMSGRFKEALDDCTMVLDLEPESFKMFQRAAKCAVSLGDLALAKSYFERIPAEKMTVQFASERDKVEEGVKMLERAQRLFGKAEGDEPWLMLVALFSEPSTFRIQCAEHFAHQKQLQRSIEALSVVVGSQRTPQVAHLLAKYLYLSGFEHFDRARTVLEQFRTDAECRDLLQLITVVDDGKQQGNQLFSQKRFAEASNFYTRAIDAAKNNDQILRILYCNRAAAYKELGRYKEGIEDCTKALKVDIQFTKAYARRARCHLLLGDHHAAIRDFKAAVKYDPLDADLADELRRAENALAEEARKEKDFYYVLGLSKTATEEQIRSKYKELALRWHPDKCMHMEEEEKSVAEHKFKTISSAYQTLVDTVKRREYDLKQERERLMRTSSYTGGFTSGSSGMPPSQPAYSRYSSGGGMPERRPQSYW